MTPFQKTQGGPATDLQGEIDLWAAHVLGATEFRTYITAGGAGQTLFRDQAVNRWRRDPTWGCDGLFIYLRDLSMGTTWSAAWCPLPPSEGAYYAARVLPDGFEIARREHQIQSILRVGVLPEIPVEIRLVLLKNLSGSVRRLELTSYTELVLQDAQQFESHPAFSKLFLETRRLPDQPMVLARRRRRLPDEKTLCAAAWISVSGCGELSALQFETDRQQFLGRGRGPANPQAMRSLAALGGSQGPVLDPIFSLRTVIDLQPGETQGVLFALAAGEDESEFIPWGKEITYERAASCLFATCEESAWNGQAGHQDGACQRPSGSLRRKSPDFTPYRHHGLDTHSWRAESETLVCWNGFGGFRLPGNEYVIHLAPDDWGDLRLPPRPWTHVLSNPRCGVIASERGALSTWTYNSRQNRCTPWSNDPVSDPCGELVFARDRGFRTYWSVFPGPLSDGVPARVEYGFGWATYSKRLQGLSFQTTVFVPREDPLRLIRLTIENDSDRDRELEILNCHPWWLSSGPPQGEQNIETGWSSEQHYLWARKADRPNYGGYQAFSAMRHDSLASPAEYTGRLRSFLGLQGCVESPDAVVYDLPWDQATGYHPDPCAAMKLPLRVPRGHQVTVWMLLGEADSAATADALVAKYSAASVCEQALSEVRDFWSALRGQLQVDTPSESLNRLLEGWLLYQNVACRLWGRSSYYQGGGAFGFRDQLQDACGLCLFRPEWTRDQILLHAAHQFPEGDVLHWWHPPDGAGVRTRFSDDLLWLPWGVLDYVQTTGDATIWDSPVPFRVGPPLAEGEQERFMLTSAGEESASLFEHCCRALDRSRTSGPHGLPLIGCGDWNDGFSRVGAAGKGESVWLAFFLCFILPRFIEVCRARGQSQRAESYAKWLADLWQAIETSGWDGEWYRRAYLDNGQPLGSAENDECRIDALVQAWSILSGVAQGERAQRIADRVLEQLVDREMGIIRLLTPAFNSEQRDVGYIRGYLAGVRENGGQYTHGILWYIRALAELGRRELAAELLQMITPVAHTQFPERVARYGAEPYVVAADVFGEPPHVGRAGWTWYTGSAGWMLRTAVESILGLRWIQGQWLRMQPCVPASWREYRISYTVPRGQSRYEIHVRQQGKSPHRVSAATLDGEPLQPDTEGVLIPVIFDGSRHRVEIELS